MGGLVTCAQATIRTSFVFQTTTCTYIYRYTHKNLYLFYFLHTLFKKNPLIYVQCLLNLKSVVESYLNSFYLLLSYRSENRQSLGELFLGFFKYYAADFRYGFCVQHVTCMRYANGQWSIWVWCKHGSCYALYRWDTEYISVARGAAYPRHSGQWKRKPIVIEGKLLLGCTLYV